MVDSMPRPPRPRRISCELEGRGFKPTGVPARQLERVELGLDELEALRLADLEGLYHEAAAERMGVSRPTFGRILQRARAAVAEAVVEGKLLVIGEAPVVTTPDEPAPCPVHGGGRRRGRGCRCPDDEPSGGGGA